MERYMCSDRYAWRKLESEVVILDTISGNYFLLNETASLVWEELNSQNEPREIGLKLAQEYDVPEEKARQDVEKLIQGFMTDGFLVSDERCIEKR